jgi:hypothetical protein
MRTVTVLVASAIYLAVAIPPLAAQRAGVSKGGPDVPTNVVVTGGRGGVTVTWAAVPNPALYRVVRSKGLGAPGVDLTKPVAALSYLDQSAEAGADYYYQVVAVYPDQSEGWGAPTPLAPAPTTEPPTGMMLPLQVPLATAPGTAVPMPFTLPLAKATFCNPAQTLPGPGPTSFYAASMTSPTVGIRWYQVPGAVAYVVERSVDGANAWTVVGSTCGGPSVFQTMSYAGEPPSVVFKDYAGGLVPDTRYVYKIKAIGAAGETGWNSTRVRAHVPRPPRWNPPTIAGSTVTIRWEDQYPANYSRSPDRYVVSSDYGWGVSKTSCIGQCKETIYGVPEGTHTFTVRSEWVDSASPFPGGVYSSVSRSMQVTIAP